VLNGQGVDAGSTLGGDINDFALYFYEPIDFNETKTNTPSIGLPSTGPATGGAFAAGARSRFLLDENGDPVIDPITGEAIELAPIELSFVTNDDDFNAGVVRTGLTWFGVESSFDYTTGELNVPETAMAAYQSGLLNTEVDPTLTTAVTNNTPIDAVNEARLYSLNGFSLRRGAGIPDALVDSILDANADVSFNGTTAGGTEVTIVSPEGGLSWVDHSTLTSTQASKQISETIESEDFVSVPGASETTFTFRTPAASRTGITDVTIFLASDPDTAAVTLPAFFEYTPRQGQDLPIVSLLGFLLALLGLIAGGAGGGGGGPCFIATAAYDTPMNTQIDVLRDVRDTYLLDNAAGTAFVDLYYHVSPAIADVVAQSPVLAAMVRLALVPVVFLGKLALTSPAFFGLLVLSVAAMFIARRKRRLARKG
jgi:hypothetical protein